MWTVFLRTLFDRKVLIASYSAAGFIFLLMFVSFYPSIADQGAEFQKLIDQYPEGLMKALDIENVSFATLENFIDLEYYSITYPLLAVLFAMTLGGGMIAAEVEKGTMEFLLAQPIARWKLLAGKYIAGLAGVIFFAIVSTLPLLPIAELMGLEYRAMNHVVIAGVSFVFIVSLYSLVFFFSSIFSEKSRVYFAFGGLILAMYLMNTLASIIDDVQWLEYFSLFYYYNHEAAVVEREFMWESVVVFVGTTVVTTLFAFWAFLRRDVSR